VARRVQTLVSRQKTLRWRRPPKLRTATKNSEPTIYYLCPDYPVPSGGIRAIYRHVDILNANGRTAAVLHHSDDYQCRWFNHSTKVVGPGSVALGPEDVLVVPEIYGPFFERLPRRPRLVVFNQNAYLTHSYIPAGESARYELFTAVMTVSKDSAEYLRFAFPGLEVSIVPYSIDLDLFYPASTPPDRRLALMPRKRPDDADQILRLLGNRIRDWEIATIEGMSELDTAAALRSAPIFLALGHREGFGLPPAEAMASGCYAIGFSGFGGREIFDPAFSSPVEDGDVLSAAREVARVASTYEEDPTAIREAGLRARADIGRRYSLETQRDELLAFFERLD
jgi:glycosyltransferase involved in cell wall biosynthesis